MRCSWVVLVALVGCKAKEYKAELRPLPADVQQAGDERIAALQARSKELNDNPAVIDVDGVVPRADLGQCPVRPPYALEMVHEGDPLPRPGGVLSGKVHGALSELASVMNRKVVTDEDLQQQIAEVRARIDAPVPEVAVVFVIDEWTDAEFELHSTSSIFQPGLVTGRAYAWSAATGAVVCAADIVATSSETLSVPVDNTSVDAYYGRNDRTEIRAALDRDLRLRLEAAIADSLQPAGPPPEARKSPGTKRKPR